MSDSWLDFIPSHERQKLRKRMRSPAEYERLREKVKGPEDLEREMSRNESLAELRFEMEAMPEVKNALKKQVEKDLREQGTEQLVDAELTPEQRRALEAGKFTVAVSSHPSTHQDHLMVQPEGNVQEKIPLTMSFNDRYVGQFAAGGSASAQPKKGRRKAA